MIKQLNAHSLKMIQHVPGFNVIQYLRVVDVVTVSNGCRLFARYTSFGGVRPVRRRTVQGAGPPQCCQHGTAFEGFPSASNKAAEEYW